MNLDISFGQVLQGLIVAALLGLGRSLWQSGLAFERIKTWAENHEKIDNVRFESLARQLDAVDKNIDRKFDEK